MQEVAKELEVSGDKETHNKAGELEMSEVLEAETGLVEVTPDLSSVLLSTSHCPFSCPS